MCERCLEQAVINSNNAEALANLAEAAKNLALHVPNSDAAVKAIVARIESIGKLPEDEPVKASNPEAAEEPELPPELARLKELLTGLGVGVEVHRFPRD